MSTAPLRIGIVIGSVRTGRYADTVADWFVAQARKRSDLDFEVIDLAESAIMEELKLTLDAPAQPTGPTGLADRLEPLDGFVVITPEYNHGYPASLKLAIDYVYAAWRAKPVSFVSYGGMAGGQRAVEQLRQVFAEMHAVTLRDVVSFHNAWEQFDDEGLPRDQEQTAKAVEVLLDQLLWWGRTLREGREKQPYTA